MTDINQIQDQDQDQDQLTGDDLSELHGLAQQLHSAGDPRAGKLWDFIAGQSGGGDGSEGSSYTMQQPPQQATSWLEDLENDLWGETAGGGSSGTAGAGDGSSDSGDTSAGSSATDMSAPEDGTESAMNQVSAGGQGSTKEQKTGPDGIQLKQPQLGPGPVESDPTAWNAFMQNLDSQKVRDYSVGELANVLTNETRDLSFIGPSASLFDNDLDNAKYVQAHAIINNAMLKMPNKMGDRTVTKAAAASPGHERDIAIMRQAYFDRMSKGADPAQGRTYFGNSAELLNSSPIGNSRHTVFARFGPFRWGTNKPQYIYIYNDPIPRNLKKTK